MCRDVDARDFGLGLLMMIKIRKINFSTIQYPPVIVCMGVCVCEGGKNTKFASVVCMAICKKRRTIYVGYKISANWMGAKTMKLLMYMYIGTNVYQRFDGDGGERIRFVFYKMNEFMFMRLLIMLGFSYSKYQLYVCIKCVKWKYLFINERTNERSKERTLLKAKHFRKAA